MMMRFSAIAAAALLVAGPAVATNSPIELKTVLADLMQRLPGQFDNAAQEFFEQELKTPKELVHGRVYRTFTRIHAPDVGENVLVGTVRYGGKDGMFDNGEFQVWTLSVDAERKAVKMAPRRFKEPAKYIDIARDADKLKGLKAEDLLPPQGAAGCDVYWRLFGEGLRGATEPGACSSMSSTLKVPLNWEWDYVLTETELWLNFAGRDASGKIVSGRPDQVHWRLGKARDFECFLSYRPVKGEPQVINGFQMHDRGDVYRWQTSEGRKATPVFATLLRGMWPSNSGRNYKDLLRMDVYGGTPDQPKDKLQYLGGGFASAESDRTGFTTPNLSGRCKLADGAATD
jgi:CpeT/CpcT family (DUF1001)